MKKPRSKYTYLIVILIIATVIWLAFFKGNSAEKAANTPTFATPETGNIEQTITAQGKLEPKEYVDVGTQVSGQVNKLYFDVGATVKKNDLLAEIDPQIYESKVEADNAKLATLNAQLQQQNAQIELAKQLNTRNENLIKSDAISKQAFDESKSALKVAEAGGTSLKAQIREIDSTLKGDVANLGYTKIYSPMDGTITSLSVKEGQTLNANQTTPTVLQVANLDTMTVRAQIAEADIMRLKEGSEVYFTVLGSTDRKWRGTLRQILPSPETVNDVVLYIALIDIDNKDRQLMTGMSTQIFFVLGKAENTLIIPSTALGKRLTDKDNETGQAYEVKVKSGHDVITKTIYVGLINRGSAQVVSGLEKDDQVQTSTREAAATSGSKKKPNFKAGPRI